MFTPKLGTSLQRSATRFAVYSTNRELTELSSQILRMVSARSSATLIWRIFAHASASGFNGMVSVTTSSSITEASMRLTAGPDNTGCVQYATTRTAPCSFNARAASHKVFAVSTMSSMITDRKSTRLNSSHANISYAVFCLKKKNRNTHTSPYNISHAVIFLQTQIQVNKIELIYYLTRRQIRECLALDQYAINGIRPNVEAC